MQPISRSQSLVAVRSCTAPDPVASLGCLRWVVDLVVLPCASSSCVNCCSLFLYEILEVLRSGEFWYISLSFQVVALCGGWAREVVVWLRSCFIVGAVGSPRVRLVLSGAVVVFAELWGPLDIVELLLANCGAVVFAGAGL